MVANPSQNYMSPEEYLAFEENSPVKHEYVKGYIYEVYDYDMAGASDAHVTISLNLASLLRNHVRGTGCRVYMADMKAYIETNDIYYYPDVMVTCDARDREFTNYKKYPSLIIEVLSPSTEGNDRGDKFHQYITLNTLQEYVLISQQHQRLDCFRRNSEGIWTVQFYTPGRDVHLQSIDFHTSLEAVYEDVTFAENGTQ
ncbi:MAG: Uma2 family endonuclease [Microcoleaceae cyanobacterium]